MRTVVVTDRSLILEALNLGEGDVAAARIVALPEYRDEVGLTVPLYSTRPVIVQRAPEEIAAAVDTAGPDEAPEADEPIPDSVALRARLLNHPSELAGQEIDVTGNSDGIYQLKIEVDPKKVLLETNENDNVSCVLLSIRKPSTVTILDSSGQCSSVASITPGSARVGTTVQVTITGYDFTSGMGVTFDGGNGPRPVASNVQLVSNTESLDQITATVTVPYKKNPGPDPLWNVRVGTGGLLVNAFRVTR